MTKEVNEVMNDVAENVAEEAVETAMNLSTGKKIGVGAIGAFCAASVIYTTVQGAKWIARKGIPAGKNLIGKVFKVKSQEIETAEVVKEAE